MKRFLLMLLILSALLLFAGGLFLKRGIHVESLSTGPATLNNISLQWHTKLELQIESLVVDPSQDDGGNKPAPDLSFIGKAVPLVQWIDRLFSKITVGAISVGKVNGSLLYESSLAHLKLSSQVVALETTVRLDENVLTADIQELRSDRFHSQAAGVVHFDLDAKKGGGKFSVNLAGSLPVNLSLTMDRKQLFFEGTEAGEITNITPFVDLFGLDHSIQKWITDYLTGTRYNLKSFSGNFPWNDPMVLLESFVAEVRVDGCQYTFAPGLEAIQSDYTDVLFKKGILVITPHHSTFYGQDGEKSWLDINFNDIDNILLTAYILTHAKANQDIVNLLKYYDIPLPVLQTEGETAVDLTLSINLNSELVTAYGIFLVEDGRVDYSGANFGVKDARIILDTNKITFEQMQVSFARMLVADIAGVFDAATASGNLDITLQECEVAIGESKLTLNGSEKKPIIHYTISPDAALVAVEASSWNIGALSLNLGSFSTPFSLDTFSGTLSSTSLSCPPFVATELSGIFSLKEQRLDLQCSLVQCQIKDLKLQESLDGLQIQYDKGLTIRSVKESQWLLNSIPVTLYPSEFKFSDALFSVTGGGIRYGNIFDAILSGIYNFHTQHGEFLLDDLDIKKESIGHFLTPKTALSVEVDGNKESLLLKVPELEMEMTSSAKAKIWSLLLKNLGAVYEHSPLLQRYMVKNGNLAIESKDDAGYHFSADIPFDYSLLVKDGIPLDHYQIQGESGDNGFRATVNRDLEIVYDDDFRILTRDLSFNIPAIMQLLKDLPSPAGTDRKDTEKVDVTLSAQKTSLFFTSEREVLADEITLVYRDEKAILHLQHGLGSISLDIDEEKVFSLTGEGLNDAFMSGLLAGANFQKGAMRIAARGTFDDFTAMFKIEDTVLRDFKSLNNILAMVNTIPALVTFSLPSYNTTGLPVDSVVAGIEMVDGVATFKTLGLESPEMTIKGSGWIDLPQQLLEMDLNLITTAKKNVNKIPLVGYILVGKKKRPSISVKLSGDLFDPEVENSTFQEVASVPFQILYRTLALPAHLVSPVFGFETGGEEEKVEDGEGWMVDDEKTK